MSPDALVSLVALSAAAAFTPGPNNMLVAASGARFGFRRSIPHILGISLGFPLMMFAVGTILGGLFQTSVILREALRWCGAAAILWMAWRIAHSGSVATTGGRPRPLTFLEAAAFQWINPKAWTFALGITAQFVQPEAPIRTAFTVGVVFVGIGSCSAMIWTAVGQSMTRWLHKERNMRMFNVTMGALIAASVLLLFMDLP